MGKFTYETNEYHLLKRYEVTFNHNGTTCTSNIYATSYEDLLNRLDQNPSIHNKQVTDIREVN
jgi:hypothetical protein